MNDSANPSPEPRPDTTDDGPTVDELFDVLTAERRRRVLSLLTSRQSPVPVEELAHAVAAEENDAEAATLSESTVREVHITLHHVHLPKLDEVELIDYERDERTVAPTNTTDAVPIDVE